MIQNVYVVRKNSELDHEGDPYLESIWHNREAAEAECYSLESARKDTIDTDPWAKHESYQVEEWPLLT